MNDVSRPSMLTVDDLFDAIQLLRQQGQSKGILDLLETGARQFSEDAEALFRISAALHSISRTDRALEILSALATDGRHAVSMRAKIDKAELLAAQGDLDEASQMLWEAHRSEPSNAWPIRRLVEILILKGDWPGADRLVTDFEKQTGVGSEILAQAVMSCQAVRAFQSCPRDHGWTFLPSRKVHALERCGMISLVKNEADIYGHSLKHHYELGIRNFCVVDNDSSDGTSEIIDRFRKEHEDSFLLYVRDPGRKHYQARKMAIYSDAFVAAAHMEGRQIDWIFYLDGDEFIAPVDTRSREGAPVEPFAALEDALADATKKVLVLHWIHGVSDQVLETSPNDLSPFQVYGNLQRSLSPVVSKVALRPGLRPTQGNHSVEEPTPSFESYLSMADLGWFLFHCPMRSVDQYRRKITHGAKANMDAPGLETAAAHWKTYYRQYEQHGDFIFRQIIAGFINNVKGIS